MKKHIEKWLNEGLINAQQAKQMLADIEKESSEKTSKKIIFTFSIIGSVLVGIGAILFVAANWQQIPHLVKIFSLMALTLSAAYGGYYLEYENKNYPKTGSSLTFLSTMLFGAVIFLTAQIYHIESTNSLHLLVSIWMLSILPYVYLFKSKAVSVLVTVLFFVWFAVFIFNRDAFRDYEGSLALLFAVVALFTFAFGKVHDFMTEYEDLSSVFEKISVFIIFFCLFLTTFHYFAKPIITNALFISFKGHFTLNLTELMLSASILILLCLFIFNPAKRKANTYETIFMICILSYCILLSNAGIIRHIFMPENDMYYYYGYTKRSGLTIYTNIFFALSILGLIMAGYLKRRMFYVNIGIFWLIVFIAIKYFDVFWKLLPRSVFFLAGGIILVGSALFFEHKRRAIKTEFKLSE